MMSVSFSRRAYASVATTLRVVGRWRAGGGGSGWPPAPPAAAGAADSSSRARFGADIREAALVVREALKYGATELDKMLGVTEYVAQVTYDARKQKFRRNEGAGRRNNSVKFS
jgi:hypothetical protein